MIFTILIQYSYFTKRLLNLMTNINLYVLSTTLQPLKYTVTNKRAFLFGGQHLRNVRILDSSFSKSPGNAKGSTDWHVIGPCIREPPYGHIIADAIRKSVVSGQWLYTNQHTQSAYNLCSVCRYCSPNSWSQVSLV